MVYGLRKVKQMSKVRISFYNSLMDRLMDCRNEVKNAAEKKLIDDLFFHINLYVERIGGFDN